MQGDLPNKCWSAAAQLEAKLESLNNTQLTNFFRCVDAEMFCSHILRRRAVLYQPDGRRDSSRIGAHYVSDDEELEMWGVDKDKHQELIQKVGQTKRFSAEYPNGNGQAHPDVATMEAANIERALVLAAEDVVHRQFSTWIFESLASGCGVLLRGSPPAGMTEIAAAVLRGCQSCGLADSVAWLSCSLLYKVDVITDEHRNWLMQSRATDAFRGHLPVLGRIDPTWAWEELEEWCATVETADNSAEFLQTILCQFPNRVRAVGLALDVDRRGIHHVGGLLTFAAVHEEHLGALAWLQQLCSSPSPPADNVRRMLEQLEPSVRTSSLARRLVMQLASAAPGAREDVQFFLLRVFKANEDNAGLVRDWSGLLKLVSTPLSIHLVDELVLRWGRYDPEEAIAAVRVAIETEHYFWQVHLHFKDLVGLEDLVRSKEATEDLLFVVDRCRAACSAEDAAKLEQMQRRLARPDAKGHRGGDA